MTTDHPAATCTYSWCTAHATACTCAYSDQFPHVARGCRYNRDADDQTAGDLRNTPFTGGQKGDR